MSDTNRTGRYWCIWRPRKNPCLIGVSISCDVYDVTLAYNILDTPVNGSLVEHAYFCRDTQAVVIDPHIDAEEMLALNNHLSPSPPEGVPSSLGLISAWIINIPGLLIIR